MGSVYLREFLTLAVVHFLAVVAPGADFAMVVKQSYVYGRRTAILTSVGIGLGMLLHFAYTLVGLGIVISQSILLYNAVKFLGAGYLFYLGVRSILAKKYAAPVAAGAADDGVRASPGAGENLPSARRAVWAGFLVNALNPKATLFFLSIFSVIVSASTPVVYQVGYCVWIFFVQIAWFSFVSLVFSHGAVRALFGRCGHWVERVMGAVFIYLGVRLALSSNK